VNFRTEWCLIVFLALFLASVIMQWMRAGKRKDLVQKTDSGHFSLADQEKWNGIENSFDFLFKDFRKLQIIKKNRSLLGEDNHSRFKDYRRFSRMEILVTVSMLIFGMTAYLFCD